MSFRVEYVAIYRQTETQTYTELPTDRQTDRQRRHETCHYYSSTVLLRPLDELPCWICSHLQTDRDTDTDIHRVTYRHTDNVVTRLVTTTAVQYCCVYWMSFRVEYVATYRQTDVVLRSLDLSKSAFSRPFLNDVLHWWITQKHNNAEALESLGNFLPMS